MTLEEEGEHRETLTAGKDIPGRKETPATPQGQAGAKLHSVRGI